MKKAVVSCLIIFLLLMVGCSEDSDTYTPIEQDPLEDLNLPNEYFNYANIPLPAHYTSNAFSSQSPFQHAAIDFDNTPANNPITDEGATLGRVLFYDKKLSANGTVACASCHKQEVGFSDTDVLSEGFDGGRTRRHSMGLTNARFYYTGKFFWDERAATLEDQVLMPFQDEVEMGLTIPKLEEIVRNESYYPPLFEAAFGTETISSEKIGRALSQFIRSMVSTTSKYDIARSEVQSPTDNFPGFTQEENQGKSLFYLPITTTSGDRVNCSGCHVSEAFVGPIPNGPFGTTTSVTNGLDAVSTDDLGINETTNNANDIGKFKAPSLRNISIRPPYMHDGRFATLKEVVEFYNSGIQKHTNLRPPLLGSDDNPIRLNLNQAQKDALVAFLETLTDYEMLSDEKYSDPFKN
ncbi:cytochrome c peroxidase [Tenacibaculum sp. MAR_2009_124]|uniref:cytochrome-c peroxidase n=1 Tax=Tenacibaculum sp. MAR_2009_124 TaxID=1250059 RepID=UPI00089A49E6|nr:cytochrome c peroxidase [Tenacibaculum sp. MAR_2009_124]SEB36902.1 cytochrome c peroxidase [Tenacibaculum sp. MAR_2009_124]